jgi:hypothetical protein
MPPRPDGSRLGYDVDENAVRFSNYLHLLRELVHLSGGWLPHVAEFEAKYRLADHLHDDARSISRVRRRLYELRHPSDYPGAPGPELDALLDRLNEATTPGEYLELAYGEAKPSLLRAFSVHLRELDPVADEPSLRLLTKLLERQQRHTGEMGTPAAAAGGLEDLGALGIEIKGKPRELRVMAPLDEPARDDFVEVAP